MRGATASAGTARRLKRTNRTLSERERIEGCSAMAIPHGHVGKLGERETEQGEPQLPRQGEPGKPVPDARESGEMPAHWKTASGLSRLSEPSKASWSRPSAATACSMVRVWATSASMAAWSMALPGSLPSASIWS